MAQGPVTLCAFKNAPLKEGRSQKQCPKDGTARDGKRGYAASHRRIQELALPVPDRPSAMATRQADTAMSSGTGLAETLPRPDFDPAPKKHRQSRYATTLPVDIKAI